MQYILALDQGGTKTMALVADADGRIYGIGKASGACHTFDGMETAMHAVSDACQQALHQANVSLQDIRCVKAGMTGADWPHEVVLLERALVDALKVPHTNVVNDCLIARRAGTDAPHGAVLCIGTGLNAAVVPLSGEVFVYGYYIADEDGGADALSRQGLRAVFDAEVGLADPTHLSQALLDRYNMKTVDELVFAYVNKQLGPVKDIAPLLFAVANEGDAVMTHLINQFGRRVSRYVVGGLRRCGLDAETVDVVVSGSVCRPENRLLEHVVRDTIMKEAPLTRVINAEYEPVVGALLMGLDHVRGDLYPMRSAVLKETARTFGLLRY